MYIRPIRYILSSLFLLTGLQIYPPLLAQAANSPTIQEFAAPLKSENLKDIAASPDGAIWLSMENTNTIEHFNPKTGKFQLYHTFTANSYPESIAVDGTGNLWFSSKGDNRAQKIVIGRISEQDGTITRYAPLEEKEIPQHLTRGVDGKIWYLSNGLGTVESITDQGRFTEFSQSNPELFYGMDGLTAGPDGNMWFTTRSGYIVSLTPLGHFTVYPLQNVSYRNLLPGIVTGPDNNLWFMTNSNTIWRVTPQGTMTPFTVPAPLNTTNWNALTSAGNRLWFTDPGGHQLVSMTMQGTFSSYSLPDSIDKPGAITTDPDGSLWFNDLAQDKIWHFTPPAIAHSQTTKNQQLFQAISIVKPSIVPEIIVAGTKGDLWFSELQTASVGRITTDGFVREQYAISQNYRYDGSITNMAIGKDDNLWFPYTYDRIYRLKPGGRIDTFATQITDNSNAYSLSSNPVDGNIWFLSGIFSYGFITPQGFTHEVGIPHNSVAYGKDDIEHLVAGPDGNLWMTEPDQNLIGRLTPHSQITEFPIHSAPPVPTGPPSSRPTLITGGPDGNVWFLESNGNKVGRITPAGVLTEFPVQAPLIDASSMTFGADENLWIAINNTLVRVTQKGVEKDFPLASDSYVTGIAAGPDGNIWFTESGSGKIGRLILHQS